MHMDTKRSAVWGDVKHFENEKWTTTSFYRVLAASRHIFQVSKTPHAGLGILLLISLSYACYQSESVNS